jgi:DNA-binding NarL/FixJ family response regulator
MEISDAVLIADSDPAARGELTAIVRLAGFVVLEAAGGDEALRIARTTALAAMVLEVPLAGLSGYEVCRAVKSEFGAELPVLFVSGARTESFDRVAGLLIGADDYLTKPVAPDELLTRLRTLVGRAAQAPRGGTGALTRREREVLQLLSQGLPQHAIAARLYISPKTVATHIEHIFRKLGVHSRAQAIALAFRERLVEAPVIGEDAAQPGGP